MPIDLEHDLMKTRLERLRSINWGSAPPGQKTGKELLLSYYERLLPVWPPAGGKLMPNDASVLATFSGKLGDEKAELEPLLKSVTDAARSRRTGLDAMTVSLVRLILACTVLRARDELAAGDDPSEPLLELFAAGYQLNPTHGAVDLMDKNGMTSIPLPTRASTEARRSS